MGRRREVGRHHTYPPRKPMAREELRHQQVSDAALTERQLNVDELDLLELLA